MNQVLKGYIEEGETFVDAVARVAVLAGQNGFMGYEICCRTCGKAYGKNFDCACTRKAEADYREWESRHDPLRAKGE